jgi:CheY-like chemotaxis protein
MGFTRNLGCLNRLSESQRRWHESANVGATDKQLKKEQHVPIKPKILVADDEPVIADTLAMILNQSGFEARAVYSGEEAVEVASKFAPDMLVCDVIMAELNGVETAILMRTFLPKLKVLLFSGQAASADVLLQARARGYEFELLAKPVHPKDLLNKLRSGSVEQVEPSTRPDLKESAPSERWHEAAPSALAESLSGAAKEN